MIIFFLLQQVKTFFFFFFLGSLKRGFCQEKKRCLVGWGEKGSITMAFVQVTGQPHQKKAISRHDNLGSFGTVWCRDSFTHQRLYNYWLKQATTPDFEAEALSKTVILWPRCAVSCGCCVWCSAKKQVGSAYTSSVKSAMLRYHTFMYFCLCEQ